MPRCGFRWQAPLLFPPDVNRHPHQSPDVRRSGRVAQECSLERGHGGVHRSLTNVITDQKEPA